MFVQYGTKIGLNFLNTLMLPVSISAWFPDQFIYTYFAPTFLYYPALTEVSSNLDYSAATVVMTIFYVVPFAILVSNFPRVLITVCKIF